MWPGSFRCLYPAFQVDNDDHSGFVAAAGAARRPFVGGRGHADPKAHGLLAPLFDLADLGGQDFNVR